ncbi:DUF6153 family protein [Arthrobacter sp. NPDC058097]|uniref:DUF6153 family protein n=1 Tax=Arthrobacter sp. NPDC058097 TaxID=3346340 RepID=UPI0036D8A218
MTAARSVAPTFLRRAGMFSLVLALIAGIFGMHVLNGHHLMHGPAVAAAAAESGGHSHRPGEAAHGMSPDAVHAVAGQEVSAAAGCPDGDCSSRQAMTVACTPSVKTSTLAVPAPGTAALGTAAVRAGPAGPVSGRSAYRPDTPSPGELSISRT